MPIQNVITQAVGVIGAILPVATATDDYETDVIDLHEWRSAVFIVQAGTIGAHSSVDFAVKGDAASNGSFTTTLTGKSIGQLVAADSDSIALVNINAEDALAQGFRYVKGVLTVVIGDDGGTPAEGEIPEVPAVDDDPAPCAVLVLGGNRRYEPVTNIDAVIEVVGG